MRLVIALVCGLSFVGLSSQAYPVKIHTCGGGQTTCCEPGQCKCLDCGASTSPHAPVTLTTFFHLHEVVTVETLRPTDGIVPFSLTLQPLYPPPKFARV